MLYTNKFKSLKKFFKKILNLFWIIRLAISVLIQYKFYAIVSKN